MQSIRSFLFVNLMLSVLIALAITLVGNLSFSHRLFKEGIDIKLASNALLFNTILDENALETNIGHLQPSINNLASNLQDFFPKIALQKEYFQVYDNKSNLLLKSSDLKIPLAALKNNGSQDIAINGVLWRLFTYHNIERQITIVTFQCYDSYETITKRIIQDSVFVILIIMPFLSILILTIINQGLDNIKGVINAVKNRDPNNLKPVDIKKIPKEIKPLIVELNSLFKKLQEYFDREKRFAADAAHELRTPLAALKIQAQVALNTNDEPALKSALRNIIKGADRSAHTVSQLLTLSRTVPEVYGKKEIVSLVKEAQQVVIDLIHFAKQKNIDIELIAPENLSSFMGNPISVNILIKNLVDNAIRYTPTNGQVQIILEETPLDIILKVVDTGPGVPPELRAKVFDRFFRILGNEAPGSGLGLSIVSQIADLYSAKIALNTPPSGKGLEIAVTFPKIS